MRQILTETESAKNRFSALVPLADIFTGIPREKKRSRRQIIPLDRIGQKMPLHFFSPTQCSEFQNYVPITFAKNLKHSQAKLHRFTNLIFKYVLSVI